MFQAFSVRVGIGWLRSQVHGGQALLAIKYEGLAQARAAG